MTDATGKYHVVMEMCGLRKAEYGNKGSNMNEAGWQKLFCRPRKKKKNCKQLRRMEIGIECYVSFDETMQVP
jgi:hypothetical protein